MKNHYTCLSLTVLLLSAGSLAFAQPVSKTLVKSFKLEAHRSVTFITHNEVRAESWDQPFMRVEMHIELENGQAALLRSLMSSGRYQLRTLSGSEGLQLSAPQLEKAVSLGGETLRETVRFVVHLPEGVVLNIQPEGEMALTGM